MDFDKIFSALNQSQRRAVETIEGPVLTVAGPGTGKTQILAVRIANILRTQQVNPENILAITFTDSGVVAIKNRLRKIIGARTAYKVNVFTFHGLCNKILSENPNYFSLKGGLRQMDDYDSIRLCRDLLDTNKYLKMISVKSKYHFMSEIRTLISTCKKESITSEIILKYCEEKRAELDMKVEEKGKITNVMSKEYAFLDRISEFAMFYDEYQKKCVDLGFYDFDDMIITVNKAFDTEPDLLLDYQEKFQYFLIDEFQDSNNAQNLLITKLCSYFDNPNLFVVGDDDQSIYRFQGASLENILNIKDNYPDIEQIVLSENYRSNQKILDASAAVIKNNVTRLIDDKRLNSNNQNKGEIFYTEYTDTMYESFDTVRKIKELINDGVEPNEIAVLVANNILISNLVHFLDKLDVPYFLHSGDNLYNHPLFAFFLNLFAYFDNPTDDFALFKVLYDQNLAISKEDLFKVYYIRNKSKGSTVMETVESISSELSEKFLNLMLSLKDLTIDSLTDNALNVFRKAILKLNLIERLENVDNFTENLSVLNSIYTELKKVAAANPRITVMEFSARVKLLQESNVRAKVEFSTGGNGVQLMTAHKSKGLEFEHVFMPFCTSNVWDTPKRAATFRLPVELFYMHESKSDEIDERRRLFYVALTRAKKSIYLSYSKNDSTQDKEFMPTQFIDEFPDELITKVTPEDFSSEAIISNLGIKTETNENRQEKLKQYLLLHLSANFRLSPTALTTFLECKRRFFYQDVFKIPTPIPNALIIGSVIHKILEEKLGRQNLTSEKIFDRIDELLKSYALNLEEHKLLKKHSFEIVSDWLAQYNNPYQVAFTEYNLVNRDIYIGEVPVNGKVDRIDLLAEKEVRVVDYKSSKPPTEAVARGLDKKSTGKYVKQLMFYVLMLRNDPSFKYKVNSATLEFLEKNQSNIYKSFNFEFSEEVLAEFEAEIHQVYADIVSLSFLNTQGDVECECGKCII